jgi:hypothetical protein
MYACVPYAGLDISVSIAKCSILEARFQFPAEKKTLVHNAPTGSTVFPGQRSLRFFLQE